MSALHRVVFVAAIGLFAPAVASAQPLSSEPTDGYVPPRQKQPSEAVRLAVYGAAGFPSPLTVGGGLRFAKAVQVGFEYGFLPQTNLAQLELAYQSYSGDLRIFPWPSGPFYFGARVGQQKLTANVIYDAGPYGTPTGSVTGDGWYVNPRMGLCWTADWGLSASIDAGVRIPLRHRVEQSATNGLNMPADSIDVVHYLVGKTIPTVTLLQLGLMF